MAKRKNWYRYQENIGPWDQYLVGQGPFAVIKQWQQEHEVCLNETYLDIFWKKMSKSLHKEVGGYDACKASFFSQNMEKKARFRATIKGDIRPAPYDPWGHIIGHRKELVGELEVPIIVTEKRGSHYEYKERVIDTVTYYHVVVGWKVEEVEVSEPEHQPQEWDDLIKEEIRKGHNLFSKKIDWTNLKNHLRVMLEEKKERIRSEPSRGEYTSLLREVQNVTGFFTEDEEVGKEDMPEGTKGEAEKKVSHFGALLKKTIEGG